MSSIFQMFGNRSVEWSVFVRRYHLIYSMVRTFDHIIQKYFWFEKFKQLFDRIPTFFGRKTSIKYRNSRWKQTIYFIELFVIFCKSFVHNLCSKAKMFFNVLFCLISFCSVFKDRLRTWTQIWFMIKNICEKGMDWMYVLLPIYIHFLLHVNGFNLNIKSYFGFGNENFDLF